MKEVTLIMGLLNCDDTTRVWELPDGIEVNIGDFAIVENKKSYALVEVIGITATHEKYIRNYIGYTKLKKVVKAIIKKEWLTELKGESSENI